MRKKSYSQEKNTLLEKALCFWRQKKARKFIKKNRVVCDMGCGYNGFFLRSVRNRLILGIGLDIEVDAYFTDKVIRLRKADLNRRVPLEDGTVDVVTSLALLEHLVNYEAHLSESFRILKSGGLLILTTPDPRAMSILKLLSKARLLDQREINDHKNYFEIGKLEKILKKIGFSKIESYKFQFGFNNLIIARK